MQAYRFSSYDLTRNATGDSVWYDRTEPQGEESLGDFSPIDKRDPQRPDDYLDVPHMSGSDYSGDCVTVSNHKVFVDEYGSLPGVVVYYGGYGTYGVMVRRDVLAQNEDMQDTLARLKDYSILDEDHESEIEMEAQNEAWESWAARDYQRGLVSNLVDPNDETPYPDSLEARIDELTPDRLCEIFHAVADRENEYWINETGNNAYIDVDRLATATTLADLFPSQEAINAESGIQPALL